MCRTSHHLVQIRAPRAADVVEVIRLLARTIGLWLPIEKLGVDAVLLNQVINTVLASAATLVALDAQHVELTHDVAEYEGTLARHHNHPSTCNARSICAVAISISDFSLVSAAFSNSSAAKSQCSRA